jgi:hypothetical protein
VSDYGEWCRTHFALMAVGGTWGVPRSGLVFQKVSVEPPVLELVTQMPHAPEMPVAADELAGFQDADYAAIKREFKLAGIEVRRSREIEGQHRPYVTTD